MTTNFTPKVQADTVSQTNKRSFSQISNNQQPTNNSNNISFDLNVQNLIPLIDHLKQQNQQLKHQRDQMQSEMNKLKSISEGVLEENHIMKKHYEQRTQDLRKIVATMSINMNEEIQDISHMIHITKNHNFAIVKNIEMTKNQIQDKDKEIQTIQNQLAELASRNTLLEEEMITRNVKIRQMEQKLEELRSQKSRQDNLFKLQEQVDRLVQQVQVLRQANTKKLKNTQTLQTRNQLQKPQYTAQNLNVIQTIKALQHQINQLRQDSISFERNLQNLRTYQKKVSQKCQKANQQRQHQTLQIEGQETEIRNKKQNIYNNKTAHRQKEVKKSELEDEKYQLEKELTRRREKINKIKNQQYQQTQAKKSSLKEKLNKQRTQHKVQIQKSYDELKFKLGPQKQRKQQVIQQLRKQLQQLQMQIDENKRTIRSMDNPVKEIIRLEFELNRLND